MAWSWRRQPKLWVSTLLAGDRAALVVAVNDDYKSERSGFSQTPAKNVKFGFDALPWLDPRIVLKVGDGRFVPVQSQRTEEGLAWIEPELADGEIYLVVADRVVVAGLQQQYHDEATFVTEAAKTKPESYLKGRRSTPAAEESE